MIKLTLLEEDQIFGENALSIFKKYGIKAAITDFVILTGSSVDNYYRGYNKQNLKERVGSYCTKTRGGYKYALEIDEFGRSILYNIGMLSGGCRPVLPFSSISSVALNKWIDNDNVLKVEYGEYPQYTVDKTEQDILENFNNTNVLTPTGKVYTINSKKYDEYEYNGRKFVRVIANFYYDNKKTQLSNGEYYRDGDAVWVEVTPITWLADEYQDIAVSERILVSGIQYSKDSFYDGNFNKTNMNKFLNKYLIKEIIPSNISKIESMVNRIFKKKNSIEPIKEIENFLPEQKLLKQDTLSYLTEDIEYLLLQLNNVDKNDYSKYNNEYQKFLKYKSSQSINRQACITYLASLAGKIQASLIINKKSNNSKIIEYLEKLKIDYLNKFIFDSKDETGITLEELYEIINNIFNKLEEFDVFKQRIIRRDLGFIYLNVFKENLENHSLSVDHVYNTYFKEFIKTIVVIIDSLKELGLIESLSEDFNLDNELKVEEVLEVINNIKFVKFNINETRNIKEIAKKI